MGAQEKTQTRERLASLRKRMEAHGIDAYVIMTDDFHASEYVDVYFKCRAYISGFTGSAGTLVVTADEAGVWTDGRYFLQAGQQLADTGITLRKMGEPGVPTIPAYLQEKLQNGQCLGYDGRTVNAAYADTLKAALDGKEIRYAETVDLVGEIWSDRPSFPAHPIWDLPESYTGKSRSEKLADLRAKMTEYGADRFLLASLDDIAWLYNLRGGDVAYNPVFMSYTLVEQDKSVLYVAPEAAPAELTAVLAKVGVEIRPYLQVYEDVKQLPEGSSLLLDRGSVHVALLSSLPESVRLINRANPTMVAKALKTPVERENIRAAHVQDGVAVTKMIYWLRQLVNTEEYKNGKVTELDVAAKLLSFRQERPGFLGESFDPIIGTGAHGAIIHYAPTEESNAPIEHNTFLLMDTGGQYWQGTTDITRTVSMGEVNAEEKRYYTAVLRGNLNLAAIKFKYGCTGANFDILSRSPLWELGYDFNHGTGHGVGYLLNVHEGPQRIRLKCVGDDVVFEEGMLTSDEPGAYLEGKFGVRLENLMLCLKAEKTDTAQFMRFEPVTMVPFDRASILPEMMTNRELELLNEYHAQVYAAVSPYLTEAERAWLAQETAPIKA